ncbi:MAG: RNA polymerase sigma factor [Planctomycetota bacterium]|jgi:RNA polymerase sigma-70 factor (ECF subfamily)
MADSFPTVPAANASPARPAEALLTERVARGDVLAFEHLIESHRARVGSLAYRLLGWPDEVDDVVQDVFVSALVHARKFRADSSLSTWLTTITVNKCRSRRRLLRRVFPRRGEQQAQAPDLDTRDKDASAPAAMDAETFACVRKSVRALPARYREVVVLRYLEEMPVGQIGEVLGLSRNAVEVRLTRARERLRERLAGLVEE